MQSTITKNVATNQNRGNLSLLLLTELDYYRWRIYMSGILRIVTVIVISLLPTYTAAQPFEQSTAQIAAWNLAGFDPIPDERLKLQAEGLADLDAEVVALVEINPPEAIDTLITELALLGACYEGKVLDQPTSDQDIGVLFKCGVQAGEPEFIEGSDLNRFGLRKAVTIDMEVGEFDFKMIIVHLKSSRAKADQETRDQQAMVIAEFIKTSLDSSREDILLVGDFNMIPGQDASNFHHLGGDDLIDFISSWDLQARFSHILEDGRANLLDGFAITRTFTNEYIRGSLRLFPMHWTFNKGRDWYRENVSDHLPFVASFRINKDRD